ncbi:uncharacterized protein LOC109713977 isoform X2 [Ananas comosus]|uniref:Uncharacterized protein LOC109713977 isoform X2 n=1 Tax=Ananas comosus TaxID=4615 RepID=A0A6P5FCC8_ANACO|nr:uncharacterized protein LOC109713977 isoform X2 [Ananas comosus]
MALFHHLLTYSPFPKLEQYPPTCRSLRKPVCRNLSLACSGEQPREKAKSSRRTKSDKEVCNELREFMSVIGLPENRVPTLKELSEHGRKDLANIVRRRGYKAITKLLLSSNANDSEYSDENHERNNSAEDKSSGREVTAPIVTAEYVFFSSDSPVMDEDTFNSNGTIFANSNAVVHKSSDSSVNILHSKAAKFIQTGELDDLEAIVVSQPVTPSIEDKFHKRGIYSSYEGTNFGEESASKAFVKDNQIEISRLKALLHQKEMELSRLKQQIEEEKIDNTHPRSYLRFERYWVMGTDMPFIGSSFKLAFLNSQAKLKAEISNIQQNIAQKDVELRAAEEELIGLKEVQIDYWANGEVVEIAGSFNGWQHRIKMDLDPSSQSTNPSVSRQSLHWTTILWLYPGVYEWHGVMLKTSQHSTTRCVLDHAVPTRADRKK